MKEPYNYAQRIKKRAIYLSGVEALKLFCSTKKKLERARLNKLRSLRRTRSPSEAHSAHLNIPAPWLLQMRLDPWILIRNEAQSELHYRMRARSFSPSANGVCDGAPNGKVRGTYFIIRSPYWVRSDSSGRESAEFHHVNDAIVIWLQTPSTRAPSSKKYSRFYFHANHRKIIVQSFRSTWRAVFSAESASFYPCGDTRNLLGGCLCAA